MLLASWTLLQQCGEVNDCGGAYGGLEPARQMSPHHIIGRRLN